MPIYEYKGQQYNIATEDRALAKDKILGYLAKQTAPEPAPADPNAQAGLLSGTTLPENPPPMGNRMVSEVGGPLPITKELPKFDVSKMPTEEEKAAATFGISPEMSMGEKALRTAKSTAYGASTALQQTWLGGARMIADISGTHQDDVKSVSKQLAKEQNAVEKTFEDNYGLKIAKNVGESILSNIPTIYTGFAAGMPAAYSTMFGQSFLQTYDDSRNEGLNVAESTARSALFGAAEVLDERIGLPALFKGLKDIKTGVSATQLAKDAANFVVKDLTGEELTYLSQYLTDMGFGLNPQAGLENFFKGAVDTALVTVGQGVVMGGAGMVTNKVLKEIRKFNPEQAAEEAQSEEQGKTVLQQGKNVTVEGAPPTPPEAAAPTAPTGAPPAAPQDLSKFKALEEEDIDEQDKVNIERLSALEKEFKEIDEKYKTASPSEFGELNRRQGQITKEMNEIITSATTPPTTAAAPKAPEVLQREAEMQMDVDKYGKPKLEEALSSNGRIFIDSKDEAGKKTYYAKGVGSIDNKYAVPLDLTPEEKKAARLAEGDLDLAETAEERDAAKKQLEDVLRPAAERAVGKTPEAAAITPPKATVVEERKPLTPEERSAHFEKIRAERQNEALEKAKLETRTPLKEVTENDLTVANTAMGLAGKDVEMHDDALPYLKKLEKAGLIRIKPGRRKSFTLTNSGEALRGAFYDMSHQEQQAALEDFLKGKPVAEIGKKPKTKAEVNKERQAKQREEAQKPKTELQKVMENEEKLESPTISKTSVIPHATVYVAPYKKGFVSSYQYYGGKNSQNSISTPLDLDNIYTTRETAIKAAARKIRERAEEDNNKVALNWLETIAPKPKTVTLDTVSFELDGDKATIIYFLDSDGVFTREDKEVYKENPDEEQTSKLTFAQYKDEEPSWYSDETIKSMDLRPILVTKEEAQRMIAAEGKEIEKAIAEEKATKEKEKPKTKIEVNKERQAKQKKAAEKPKEAEKPAPKIKDEDNGKPGSFVDHVVKDFAEKAQQDFLVGDDVRVGNTPGTVVGIEGDYIKFRPISATNPKAYQRVQKKNVEFVSRPAEGLDVSASKSEESKFGTEAGQLNADMAGLVQLLGANMYASNLVDVTVKELLQNSFDAVKGAVSSKKEKALYDYGHITIEVNEKTRTIKITDDARGMTTDIVKNALFTVAGSDKSDLDPSERSGGLGLAKMGFMMGAERLKVDTVRNGVRTVVDTSGENIARSKFEIKKTPAPKGEHGTTIEVKIPEHYTDPKTGDKKDIWFPYSVAGMEALKNPLIGPVEVKLIEDDYGTMRETILPSGINFDKEATPFLTKANFDWGSADVYFGVQRKDNPKHQVLSSGVYQFNGPNKYASHFMLNQQEKIPYDIIINIKPNVDAKHPDYPFENSRESFKTRLSEDIESLGAFLTRVARGEEAKDLKESFEGIVSMPRVEVGEDVAEVSKKLKKVFDQRGVGKETKIPEMPKEINIKDNIISDLKGRVVYDKVKEEEKKKESSFKAEKEAPTNDQFMIEMKQDPKLPIFHNNTNVDFVEIGRKYGDPEKFFAELGTLMVEMKEELAKSGIYKYDILKPENLFFGGVSVDKGYGGVHIKVPYKAVFLNPFYNWGAKSLFGVRQNFLNTMIHEIAHTGDMDHGVGHNTQMMRVEQYLADQGLLDYFRDAIMDILSRHESTFTAMKEEYEKSTTANIAKSLEDINKGAKSARGDDSGGGNKVSQLSARTGQGRNEPVRPSAEDAEEEYDRRQEYLDQREADGRGDFKLKHSPSVKDFLLGSYKTAKAAAKAVKETPMLAVNKMTSKLDRAVTFARIKGIWYGRGLEVEEVKRYNGQVRDGQKKAISTVALTNALHSGEIMAQVIMRGNLVFDTNSQMFRAEDAKESMANVMLAKHDLIERVGVQEANNMIQDYFEAKRSRSILDSFVKQEGAVEKAKQAAEKLEYGSEAYFDALDEVEKAKRDFYNIAIARSKVSLSDESIDIYSALEDDNPELRIMMDNWQAVNKNIIDNMEFSGLISKKRAKQLRDIKDYVPWQRIQDDMEDVHSPQGRSSTKSLTNVAKEKVFKRNAAVNKAAREYIDGEIDLDQFNEVMQQYQEHLGEIDDILDNMLHNVAILGRNSMRNHAANMIAARYAERYTEGKKKDKLRLFREEGKDENGVRVNIVINGRRVIINIQDPLIAEAVIGMENINMPAVQVFAVMANLLRRGITTWPQFQLRQLFMDAPTAAMVSGLGAKNSAILYADTFKSFLNALNSEDPIVRHLQAYGIGGFQSYTRSPEKLYKQKIGLVEHNKLDQFTNLLDKVGDASDMAQRIATYKRVLAETGDETLALIRANNIIDFKKHGNSKIAVALTRSVSFMNAYAQQLDVLAEALAGGGLKGKNRGAAFASMLKAASMLTMWTVIYTMIMGGNDDYENMDDQKKARNFVIPKKLTKAIGLEDNVLLPMNTSPSFFFKAMPELITNYVLKKGTKNEVDGTRLRKALSDAFVDSMLGPNPIPTGIKPFAEIGLNHNFFTGGTITPKGMEGLDAAEQYNASVSELGKVISALTGRALNPFEADHLVRGIFGTNGALVMWGSNLFSGERPTAEQKDNPLWGGLLDRDVGRNKEALFYDLKNEVEPKHKTFMKMVEREKDVEADKYFDKHEKELEVYEYVKGIEAALKEVNKEIRRVGEVKDPKLTKDDRRKEILELQNTKNEILEDVIEMRKAAGL